jgi:hypothetical protein
VELYAVRERLAADPWLQDGTLSIVSIERWTILLDGIRWLRSGDQGSGRDSR